MKKFIMTTVAAALLAGVAIAQDKPAAPVAKPVQTGDPVIIAAGELAVRQSEFETAVKTLPAEYQQYALGPGKKQFAEDFLRMKLLAAQGMKEGLDKTPEVTQQLSLIRENLVANAELSRIEKGIAISDADLQKAYDANKSQYEQVKAHHILIAMKGSPVPLEGKKELTDAEAKAKAEEIRAKLVAGASFADLAKAESYDTGSGARGGELGAFTRGQMVPEFEKAAFEGKVGEVLPIVKTQFGYHIIKVDEHSTTPFAEVKEALDKTERQKRLQARLDEIKSQANATFNSAYFGTADAAATPATPPAVPPVKK